MSFQSTIYGKYFLLDRIAVGGMAEVFKAKTYGVRGFERLLVIKRILPHLSKDEEFVEMFIDEAKISVELNHANICQVTDLGKIDGNYFIAMEYIDGKDLRAILKKCYTIKTPLTIPMAIYTAMEILKGLDYAHRRSDQATGKPLGLIHRDISPQNIMISYHGEIKIVDFGIAKTESKLNKTQAGVLKGKFGYMSPEQASGLELDARTDIFSAGIILYEMLTGRRLFLGETDFETLEKIRECDIPPPSKYNPAVSSELESIVLKALPKEKEDRFASAQEFHSALAKLFYSAHSIFSPRELSEFLRSIFSEEMEQEKEALKRAIDALPPEELEAAISGAESANDRIVDSGSRRHSNSASGSSRRTPIGATRSSGPELRFGGPSLKKAMRILFTFVAPALLVVLLLTWLWPSRPITSPNAPSPVEGIEVQISTDPPGASVTVQGQVKGTTPLTTRLPNNQAVVVQFEMEGFTSRAETLIASSDRIAFGPFILEKSIPTVGNLKVTSAPQGASIYINGKDTGNKTPGVIENLRAGENVKVKVALEGYSPKTQTVVINSASESVSFDLEEALVTLSLRISPPNATVFLNGRERGQEILDLPAGKTYTLKVTANGYEPLVKRITPRNPREVIEITLKEIPREYGTMNLGANPWAKIFVDGKELGETPVVNHRLTVGSHVIEFMNPHYKTVRKKVTVRQGRNPAILVDFKEEAD